MLIFLPRKNSTSAINDLIQNEISNDFVYSIFTEKFQTRELATLELPKMIFGDSFDLSEVIIELISINFIHFQLN